jgi:predicted GTPase
MDLPQSRPDAFGAEPAPPRASGDYRSRIVIVGAAGRGFHNFNVVYRNDRSAIVVAFTAAQISGIAGRRYPAPLAGNREKFASSKLQIIFQYQ